MESVLPVLPKPKPRMATLYFRGIPRDLRDHFKAACYKRGSDMQAEIIRFMKDYLKEKK